MFFWTTSSSAPQQPSNVGTPVLTFTTTSLAIVLIIFYLVTGSHSYPTWGFQVRAIMDSFQIYRLLSFHFVHSSLAMLLINLLALGWVSTRMEQRVGSLMQLTLIVMGMVVMPLILFLLIAFISLLGWESALAWTSLGISGIIFYLLTIDYGMYQFGTDMGQQPTVALFGIQEIPRFSVVLVVLLLSSLLNFGAQSITFVTHLSGILSGYLVLWQEAALVNALASQFQTLEEQQLESLSEIAMFIKTPASVVFTFGVTPAGGGGGDRVVPASTSSGPPQAYSLIETDMI